VDTVNGTRRVLIRNVRQVSGKCAQSRHECTRFNMSVFPSVCHLFYLSARIISAPTKRISVNFNLGTFIGNYRENSHFVQIRVKLMGGGTLV